MSACSGRGRTHTHRDPLGLTWAERRLFDALPGPFDRPTSFATLAREAWGTVNVVPADWDLVRQHIYNIRRKLGEGAVQTFRGRGYRLGPMWREERAAS